MYEWFQILIHIFKYLPLEDRKTVKLTCKSWLKWCSDRSITQNEIYVLRPGATDTDIARILCREEYMHVNFEFHFTRSKQLVLPCPSIEEYGYKVHEIAVRPNCRITIDTLKCIIDHCVNLTSLKISRHWEGEDPASVLDYFVENNIKRTQLHTLEIFYPYSDESKGRWSSRLTLSPDTIKNLFTIFPCLKHFGIKYYGARGDNNRSIPDETVMPVELVSQLESLIYLVRSSHCWLEKPIIPVMDLRFAFLSLSYVIIFP